MRHIPAFLLLAACGRAQIPDQESFAPLDELPVGQAHVRLYVAPLPVIGLLATHPWFVVRSAEEEEFHRWEVWQTAQGPHEHVTMDLLGLESDVGGADGWQVAELHGADAEPVVRFIQERSPEYPCRDTYRYWPGPNSNSYAQWVLDETGWDAELPRSSLGKGVGRCRD